ncbi:MAG: GTP-binding protein [Candidatus Acididesulfobacter guangdongensis]|uniref:phospholipase D n=1 Tax=Acididesulfobacter guangdongensis TaxID=2597225 RepID=A0A519BGW7_ACIG2|nr:MAG: GTP-binding protein [Candidatus Acididesulfobacter guangdongensis]
MLYIMPNAGVKPIVRFINHAKRDLDVNVYYLNDEPIFNAIRYAVKRGVDVKIMIDGKPYKMSIRKEEQKIKQTKAHFEIDEKFDRKYVFDHAKYMLDNHEALIGTANFDWSAFHKNREYEYTTYNKNTISSLRNIFNSDYRDIVFEGYMNRNLVVSPKATQKLLSVINQPGKIDIETEELGYDRSVLSALARKGSAVRIIVPSAISYYDKKNLRFLERYGVKVRLMPVKNIYIHAKMIVGAQEAFIGSENFTYTSLNKNREVGIIIYNDNRKNNNNYNSVESGNDSSADTLKRLRSRFNKDWSMAD